MGFDKGNREQDGDGGDDDIAANLPARDTFVCILIGQL